VPGYIVWQALEQSSRPLPAVLDRMLGGGAARPDAGGLSSGHR